MSDISNAAERATMDALMRVIFFGIIMWQLLHEIMTMK